MGFLCTEAFVSHSAQKDTDRLFLSMHRLSGTVALFNDSHTPAVSHLHTFGLR